MADGPSAVAGRARFLVAVAVLLAAAVEGSSLIKAASDLMEDGSGLIGVSFTEISFFTTSSGLTSTLTGLTRVFILVVSPIASALASATLLRSRLLGGGTAGTLPNGTGVYMCMQV